MHVGLVGKLDFFRVLLWLLLEIFLVELLLESDCGWRAKELVNYTTYLIPC